MARNTSLSFKITSFSTSIILLTSLCVALIVYFATTSFFLSAAIKNMNNETKLIANNIENSFIKINNDINVLIKTPPIQGIIRSVQNNGQDTEANSNITLWKERLSTIFASMLDANPNYTQIRYIGVKDDGKELVRVNQTNQGINKISDTSLQSKANESYFKKAIQLSQGSVMFSNINYNREKNKIEYPLVPTLRAITPVYTSKHELFGILAININISRYLRNILIQSAINYDVILHDEFNDFFIYNHDTKKLDFISPENSINRKLFGSDKIKSTKQIMPFLEQDTSRITITKPVYSNTDKDHKVFTVVISIPKKQIKTEDRSLLFNILAWVVALCLISFITILVFTRKVMQPLTKMTESIRNSGRFGDKELKLPTHLNDEVGLLARAFEEKTKLLGKLALFDSLTGLPNRKNFIDRLEEAIHHAKRQDKLFALIYLDINKFKEINDTYGHDYGDDLLIKFSHQLKNTTRDNDYCARLGGDEFAVLIQDLKSVDDIPPSIKRYEAALNTTYIIKGVTLNILISGGLSIYPNDSIIGDDLLRFADETMYKSKTENNGLIYIYGDKK